MTNEVISIVGLAEVNSNWIKISIKESIYNKTDGWFLKRRVSTGNNRVTNSDGPFQSGGTDIMAMDEVSFRSIVIGQ